jgi:hypothetical protein
MRLMIILAIVLMTMPSAPAHDACAKAECEKIRQQIRQIQSRMRQGYTARQGEKLKADLRKFKAKRSQQCR